MRVTLHVWRVPRHRIGGELLRMALGPRRLRSLPGVRFAKLLGTADGFGPRDADWTRYAAVVVADREVPFAPPGDRARVELTPLHSRGTWSGRTPFDGFPRPKWDGLTLALTRARLRPATLMTVSSDSSHSRVSSGSRSGNWLGRPSVMTLKRSLVTRPLSTSTAG